MDLIFSKIVNRERRKVEMLLYGALGEDQEKGDINGHQFARELNWLAREYDEIKIRVNCEGGMVSHGLSIVSEMMASPAYIIVQVDGIAASMAAVLLPAADKVTMNDYAKVMIHSPYYADDNGEAIKKLSAKDRKAISTLKDMLKQLLTKRGMEEEKVNAAMRTDTWYSAEEALEAKLVDEILSTGKKKELAALEPMKLVAKIFDEVITQNSKSMKKVIAKLKGLGVQLDENASEDQVVAALETINLNDEKPSKKVIDQLIVVGKKTGVVTEGDTGNEAKFRRLAEADMDLFVDMLGIDQLGTAPAQKVATTARMSELVAAAKGKPVAAAADEKNFAWYEKNDPAALAKMEVTDPEKFAKLEAADKAQYE